MRINFIVAPLLSRRGFVKRGLATRRPPQMAETLHEGKFLALKKVGRWEYATRRNCTGDAVIIVSLTAKGELVLVSQHRPPVDAHVLEWPAGLIGDDGNTDVMRAAERELMEECGCRAEKLLPLVTGVTTAGLTDEKHHMVAALNCEKVEQGGGVGGENITVHIVARTQLSQFIDEWQRKGGLVDLKIFAGLNLVNSLTK